MLNLAEKYARLKGTRVIEGAYSLHDDGSITFVLASGPKLTMTEGELDTAIEKLEAEGKAVFGNVVPVEPVIKQTKTRRAEPVEAKKEK